MKSKISNKNITKEAIVGLSSYSPLVQKLLFNRGIETKEAAERYFSPDYKRDLSDPFLILNMDKAVKRILHAIDNNESIVIYADYDADGIPGSVALHDFFKKIKYENFEVYIPHRYKEGYGLNKDAIEEFAKNCVSLIITIDSGITDNDEVEYANEVGIDVIITDHHLPLECLPKAYCIINPNQKDCTYSYSDLCGGGLAFKLIQALLEKGEFGVEEGWEKNILDVACISTISDMVPLTGENRAIAKFGIEILKRTKRPGLINLFNQKKISTMDLTEEDVSFVITPRINAASRMDVPITAFNFLSTRDPIVANEIGKHLERKNSARRRVVIKIIEEAENILGKNPDDKVIVIGKEEWMPGVLGLAANKLVEKYERPSFVWGKEGGDVIRGSVRSDGSISVVDLMSKVKDGYFINFGGHQFSGGFSIDPANIALINTVIGQAFKDTNKINKSDMMLDVDGQLQLDDITWTLLESIQQFAPFGIGNNKPVFIFKDIQIDRVIYFGNGNNHIKLIFRRKNGSAVQAIRFFNKDNIEIRQLVEGNHIDLVATIEKNVFRGIPEIQLRIVDLKSSE